MIGWPVSRLCAVACRLGELSQQPMWPQLVHIRRCTHRPPIFRQSSQPEISAGSSVTTMVSRWEQSAITGHGTCGGVVCASCQTAEPVLEQLVGPLEVG